MKLLLDMNLSSFWVDYLAGEGIDSQQWSDFGENNAPDSRIMAHARQHKLIVLTQDLDFGMILAATNQNGPSVIQLRTVELDPIVIGHLVVSALKVFADELDAGALVTVDVKRTRLSMLPLRPM